MQYVSDRLFTKVSGTLGDAAYAGITLPFGVAPVGALITPDVKATDAGGRELPHMDRTARLARDRGAAVGAALAGIQGARKLGPLGALIGAPLGAIGGALATPASRRTLMRLTNKDYYRDPGKPLGARGITLPTD